MSGSGQPNETVEADVLADEKPACVALVPVVASAQWSRPSQQPRPDSTFLTHLIATAEQDPQTRTLRQATPADAQAAYRSHQRGAAGTGVRTRQTA